MGPFVAYNATAVKTTVVSGLNDRGKPPVVQLPIMQMMRIYRGKASPEYTTSQSGRSRQEIDASKQLVEIHLGKPSHNR